MSGRLSGQVFLFLLFSFFPLFFLTSFNFSMTALVSIIVWAVLCSQAISWWINQSLEIVSHEIQLLFQHHGTHRLPETGISEINALGSQIDQIACEKQQQISSLIRQHNQQKAVLSSMVEGVLMN
ncbi:MAG: hypothetical protein ACE5GM_06575 [bacterium]